MRPRMLSLSEIWELKKLLGDSKRKTHLLDEIAEILKSTHPKNIKLAMQILYKTPPTNPLRYGLALTDGLVKNSFFDFQEFVSKLK